MKKFILFCMMILIGTAIIYLSLKFKAWIWESDMPTWLKIYFMQG